MSTIRSRPVSETMDLAIGFGSLVIIPFLGILGLANSKAYSYLVAFLGIWFMAGLAVVAGGITPIGPGDIVTEQQRNYWLGSASVHFVERLWVTGFALGLPLLVIAWVYERTRASVVLKVIKAIATIAAFGGGLVKFLQLVAHHQ